ncbi:FAD-dependent monooxygenase [Roseomonas sp. NAR14]|uniref:FAD-dependent monooxygenase n=1 Tax=Roseomonas acroporae TaxID=2937791 RepID=A0A9X1YAQ3_9PROT|nr:FAD-dependent monooxygenase [Roseomonas acroporae]MCK8786666.1 FAD-dependent monooxygenase [Roseomonas acroporae]
MRAATRIAVVGAGLGGLTLAGLLQRRGFDVSVHEQATGFARIGAGIILSANAVKVLRRLGLEPGIVATGIRPDSFLSRDIATGETLYELTLDAASERRFGGPFVNIHRADLHALLQSALRPGTIRFGEGLAGLEERDDHLRLIFADGGTAEADIVVGADGIHSRLRALLQGEAPPRFTGRLAMRAVFPPGRIPGPPIRDCTKWWADDRHVLVYFMTGRRDEVYVMTAVPADSWEGDDTSVPGTRAGFLAGFEDAHPDLRRVLEAAETVMVWPICDRPRDDRWHAGRAVLLGDACHAVRPYMAAGGASAIEDAGVLARCLAEFDDHGTAFARYAATRIPRVAEVQRISIENSWMRGPTELDWFFGHDVCTAPLA